MTVTAFRLKNFMAFEDTAWIELRPITLLFGKNSSGKSAILKALLMLRQSLEDWSNTRALVLSSSHGTDLGTYKDVVYKGQSERDLWFGFRCIVAPSLLTSFKSFGNRSRVENGGRPPIDESEAWATMELAFGLVKSNSRVVGLKRFEIRAPWSSSEFSQDNLILAAEWLGEAEGWDFRSDFLTEHVDSPQPSPWALVQDVTSDSDFLPFLPSLQNLQGISSSDYEIMLSLLQELRPAILSFLGCIVHIGPVRSEPQRFYYLPALESSEKLGRGHAILHQFLSLYGTDVWDSALREANKAFGRYKMRLQPRPCYDNDGMPHEGLFEIRFQEIEDGGVTANITNMGSGIGQVLAIVLGCALAKSDTTLLIEQPELHFHPGGQAQFADLFLDTLDRQARVIAETHSEHLVLRLQQRVKKRKVTPERISILYVTRRSGSSWCHALHLDEEGDFQEHWPEGFFQERFEELFGSNEDASH